MFTRVLLLLSTKKCSRRLLNSDLMDRDGFRRDRGKRSIALLLTAEIKTDLLERDLRVISSEKEKKFKTYWCRYQSGRLGSRSGSLE